MDDQDDGLDKGETCGEEAVEEEGEEDYGDYEEGAVPGVGGVGCGLVEDDEGLDDGAD